MNRLAIKGCVLSLFFCCGTASAGWRDIVATVVEKTIDAHSKVVKIQAEASYRIARDQVQDVGNKLIRIAKAESIADAVIETLLVPAEVAVWQTQSQTLFTLYTDEIASIGAKPIPADVEKKIRELLNDGKLCTLNCEVPFNEKDIKNIRWISSSKLHAKFLHSGTYREGFDGIVYRELLIIDEDYLEDHNNGNVTQAEWIGFWAHELTHVAQYRRLGAPRFLKQYLREAAEKGYEKISFEIEAEEVERHAKIAIDPTLTGSLGNARCKCFPKQSPTNPNGAVPQKPSPHPTERR